MKRTTKVAGIALAATLLCSTAVPALAAGRFGSGAASAGTGVCQGQNRIDEDGDGACDNAGTCQHYGCHEGTCVGAGHRHGNGR